MGARDAMRPPQRSAAERSSTTGISLMPYPARPTSRARAAGWPRPSARPSRRRDHLTAEQALYLETTIAAERAAAASLSPDARRAITRHLTFRAASPLAVHESRYTVSGAEIDLFLPVDYDQCRGPERQR
jgi:hypothetical protein